MFSICGLCPAHKVLAASFSSSQMLACLLLKGWVRLARFANFLAKMHPLKGRAPVPVGAVHGVISAALCASWCFKGKGGASATFLSHVSPTLPGNDAALQ